jgi:very-short-patch-repair endonuclease
MTLPEVLLWQRLRAEQLGVKFRKQHSIPPYTVDFFCPCAKLVVEVDGMAHDNAERAARVEERDRELTGKGLEVLRLPASLILSDMEAALAAIAARVESPLRQPLRGCHLPASGEDSQ